MNGGCVRVHAAFTTTPRLRSFSTGVHELRAVPSTSALADGIDWRSVGGGSRLGSGPQSAQSVP